MLDLLFLDTKQENQDEFSEAFSLSDRYPIQQHHTFHPAADNDFEEDCEEEMVKIINPNKHI